MTGLSEHSEETAEHGSCLGHKVGTEARETGMRTAPEED